MGRWTDIATWAGPIPNCGPGNMTGHMGVVIHTAEGSYAGTDSWQRNPAADVGSHFLTAKDGRVEQLIDTDIRSWCQSAGNDQWISIENEGFGSRGESLSSQQVENCARILAKAHQVYGIPLVVSNSPGVSGLGWHGMGGTAWGGHFDCPGNNIRAQLPAIVARAAEILGGGANMAAIDDILYTLTHLAPDGQSLALHAAYPGLAADAKAARAAAEAANAKLATIQTGGQPTQAQVDSAVLAAMLDPRVQKGIGDAVASHIHVS